MVLLLPSLLVGAAVLGVHKQREEANGVAQIAIHVSNRLRVAFFGGIRFRDVGGVIDFRVRSSTRLRLLWSFPDRVRTSRFSSQRRGIIASQTSQFGLGIGEQESNRVPVLQIPSEFDSSSKLLLLSPPLS